MSTAVRRPLSDYLKPDGSLLRLLPYLRWNVGEETATLDGDYTAAELRAIADHMDAFRASQDPADAGTRWRVRISRGDGRGAGIVFYGTRSVCEKVARQMAGKPVEGAMPGIPRLDVSAVAEPDHA